MTDAGHAAIAAARNAGTWDTPARATVTLSAAQRTYTGAYFSTKTEAGRAKKLLQLVERLELNLDPMASLAKKKAELGL